MVTIIIYKQLYRRIIIRNFSKTYKEVEPTKEPTILRQKSNRNFIFWVAQPILTLGQTVRRVYLEKEEITTKYSFLRPAVQTQCSDKTAKSLESKISNFHTGMKLKTCQTLRHLLFIANNDKFALQHLGTDLRNYLNALF